MMPRTYEFTCRLCSKTVKESSDSDVCASCATNPGAASAPPPPVKKTVPPPAPVSKKGGFSITITKVPKK